jgi:hypothetical protein
VSRWPLLAALMLVIACPSRAPHGGLEPVDELDRGPGRSSSDPVEPTADAKPVAFEGSGEGCERTCGQLHDCLLAEPPPAATPHQAAALELDCLQLCVESGPALTDSRFATCAAIESCGELLPCMRATWPAAPVEPVEPTIEPSGSEGCRLGCKRLGECFDSSPDNIDECARGCEQRLDTAQQTAFGECMQIADCLAMLECMRAFPGA